MPTAVLPSQCPAKAPRDMAEHSPSAQAPATHEGATDRVPGPSGRAPAVSNSLEVNQKVNLHIYICLVNKMEIKFYDTVQLVAGVSLPPQPSFLPLTMVGFHDFPKSIMLPFTLSLHTYPHLLY